MATKDKQENATAETTDTSKAPETAAPEEVKLVRMVRVDPDDGTEHWADVHPQEVVNYAKGGYYQRT